MIEASSGVISRGLLPGLPNREVRPLKRSPSDLLGRPNARAVAAILGFFERFKVLTAARRRGSRLVGLNTLFCKCLARSNACTRGKVATGV